MKSGFVALFAAIFCTSAHADWRQCILNEGGRYQDEHPVRCTFDESTFLPLVSSLMTSGTDEMKEAYIAQLQDDAAVFVASDGQGVASPILQEAIRAVRVSDPNVSDLSDLEVARKILE